MLMLLTVTSVAFAADGTLTGSGTKAAPFLIEDAEDFAAVAADPAAYNGKYVALGDDITLDADSFVPIGSEAVPFKGFFDGKGHEISGDDGSFGDGSANDIGLFGYVENAEIKDLTVTGMMILCPENSGVLVGHAKNSQISGVDVRSSSVDAVAKAGGIVGYLQGGSVADCRNSATITLCGGNDAGGIVGRIEGGEVLRCINSGAVTAQNKNCGGIAGYCDGTISHCINTGVITSEDADNSSSAGVAGIAGYLDGEISCCGNAGNINSDLDCAGIFCASGAATVSFCYNAGSVSSGGSDRNIGFFGSDDSYDHCIGVEGSVDAASLKNKDTFEGWDFTNVWFEPADYHNYPYPVLRDCSFHTMVESVLTTVSCTTPEVLTYSCECGFSYNVTTKDALDHQWDAGVVTQRHTCKEEGVKTFTCQREGCDEQRTEPIEIDPDAHDFDENNVCKLCGTKKQEEQVKRNFFQKIGDFFRRIFDWIRNLFKKK